ncbi:hypothetical protein NKI51_27410 [Mesorhizobium australicum]|uniref:hypothetical protein n=1 Tax=Mesorhizobium australicum TaxID=536018 RepID=UPI00333829AA
MPYPVLDTPVSPLRQRLIDDMNMRRFSRETQRNYLRDIGLATFLGRSPHTASADDLRRFHIEQQDDGVPVPTMNSIVSIVTKCKTVFARYYRAVAFGPLVRKNGSDCRL